MFKNQVKKVSVFDERIVQPEPLYKICKGGSSISNKSTSANDLSNNSIGFNIIVPSLNVFVDRRIMIRTTVDVSVRVHKSNVRVVGANPAAAAAAPADTHVLRLGKDIAIREHFFHQLVSTATVTLNETTVSCNMSDVLQELLLLMESDPNNRNYSHASTSLISKMGANRDVPSVNSAVRGFDNEHSSVQANGSYFDIQFTDNAGNVLVGAAGYDDGIGGANYQQTQVSDGIPILTNGAVANAAHARQNYRVNLRITTCEELILPPFLFNKMFNTETGLFGINQIQLSFNLKSQPTSAFYCVRENAPNNATQIATANNSLVNPITWRDASNSFVSAHADVTFISPSLETKLPSMSIVPFIEFPRTKTIVSGLNIAPGGTATISSTAVNLPSIPDFLILYCKPNSPVSGTYDNQYYLPIIKVNSLNFDNMSGLLSSHTMQQLYRISYDNGLKLPYSTWYGNAYGGAQYDSKQSVLTHTLGGFLILRPGKDFPLKTGQAPGVLGNRTLQFDVTIRNPKNNLEYQSALAGAARTITSVSLNYIAVNSGFFVTSNGTSMVQKSILQEQDVLSAPHDMRQYAGEMERYIGGGFFSNLANKIKKGFNQAKHLYEKMPKGVRDIAEKKARQMIEKKIMGNGMPSVSGGGREKKVRLSSLYQ